MMNFLTPFNKKRGVSLYLSSIASGLVALAILLQANSLGFQYGRAMSMVAFLVYGLLVFGSAVAYRRMEVYILGITDGRSTYAKHLFFLIIGSILLVRTLGGHVVLVDLLTLGVVVLVRVLVYVLNEEQCDLTVSRINEYKKYLPTFVIWVIILYLIAVLSGDGRLNNFLWDSSDARHYKWLSDQFTILNFDTKSYFAVGMPLLMVPMNILAGTYHSRELQTLVSMNLYSIVVMALILWPISIGLFQNAIVRLLRLKESVFNYSVVGVTLLSLNFLYLYLVPPYATEMDHWKHSVMVLGLVPAVEVLNLLFVSFSLYALVHYRKLSCIIVGIVAGIAILAKSTNLLPVGLFFVAYFLLRSNKRKAIGAALIAGLVFLTQLFYAFTAFGGGIYPGRVYQTERLILHSDRWITYVNQNYDLQVSEVYPLDIRYIPENLVLFLGHYWIPLLLCFIAFGYLVWVDRKNFLVYSFCFSLVSLMSLSHTAFFRFGATFRYNHLLIFPAAFLVIAALVLGYNRRKRR